MKAQHTDHLKLSRFGHRHIFLIVGYHVFVGAANERPDGNGKVHVVTPYPEQLPTAHLFLLQFKPTQDPRMNFPTNGN